MRGNKHILNGKRMPKKAILLAAGYGTRMEPLSWDLPKPLMPYFGVPLLEHALLTLETWGVEDVLINVHHAPDEILAWFRAWHHRGPRVVFSFEADILGTGGALRKAEHFIGDDACWLVNTDVAFSLDPRPMVKMFRTHLPPAVLWLDAVRGPRTVSCDARGVIDNFAVQRPGTAGTYTYCGIMLFHPRLLQGLPNRAFCSIIEACEEMMRMGQSIYGHIPRDAYWADLGAPERYLNAHVTAPDVLRKRGSWSGGEGRTSRQPDVVTWSGASIAPSGSASRSILGRGVRLHVPVQDSCVVRADSAGMPSWVAEVLRALRMPLSETLYVQLPRRGSDRNFVRLVAGRRSAILIQYRSDRRPENARYAGHARFLAAHGIRVPRVLESLEEKGILVLEDVGSQSLQCVEAGKRDIWYRRVMPHVARMHAIPLQKCPPLEPAFDARLYAWEHDLFLEQYLSRYCDVSLADMHIFRGELQKVSRILRKLPHVLIHRDLQSSNILLHRKEPVFIDFQGMRAGPAVYDLASLLYDPYVALGSEQRRKYAGWYLSSIPPPSCEGVDEMLPVGGIQRLVQALGAFGRLGANADTARFEKYIPAARHTLESLLETTQLCPTLLDFLRRHAVHVGMSREE